MQPGGRAQGSTTAEPGRWAEYALSAGELGAAAGQTVMVTVLPLLLAPVAPSPVAIGFVVGGEGLFALVVPWWVGRWSDRLHGRAPWGLGRRTFFLAAAAPVLAATLAIVPFLAGFVPLAIASFMFFAALHAYFTPLWTLLVDAVPQARRGRVQGKRGLLRALGLAYGLAAGGLLWSVRPWLPFAVAAALVVATTAVTVRAAPRDDGAIGPPPRARALRGLRRRPAALWVLAANALWNGAVDGVRPFVFLYATAVLGLSVARTSTAMLLLVGVLALAAPAAGALGDRLGHGRVLLAGALVCTAAFGAGIFVREAGAALALTVLAGLGASTLIASSFPLFASLVDERQAGENTGVFVLSLGFGRMAAPLLVGAAVDAWARRSPQAGGYPMMWGVAALLCGLATLALAGSRRAAARAPGIARGAEAS